MLRPRVVYSFCAAAAFLPPEGQLDLGLQSVAEAHKSDGASGLLCLCAGITLWLYDTTTHCTRPRPFCGLRD